MAATAPVEGDQEPPTTVVTVPTEPGASEGASLQVVGAWQKHVHFVDTPDPSTACPTSSSLRSSHRDDGATALPFPTSVEGLPVKGHFPQELNVGYLAATCGPDLVLYPAAANSGGIITRFGLEDVRIAVEPSDLAELGWEDYRTVRVGRTLVDLSTGATQLLPSDDVTVRTVGVGGTGAHPTRFRYVYDTASSGCTNPPELIVEDRDTGLRHAAFTSQEAVQIQEFASTGVTGLAAWSHTQCDNITRVVVTAIDPVHGKFVNPTTAYESQGPLVFDLHVSGTLTIWEIPDLGSGNLEPTLQIEAPDFIANTN